MSQRSNCSHHCWMQTSLIGPLWWAWFISINKIYSDSSSGAFSFLPMPSTGKKNKTQTEPVFLALSSESPDQDKKACVFPAAHSPSVASLHRWMGMCSEFTQHDGPDSTIVQNKPQTVIHLWDDSHRGQAVRSHMTLPKALRAKNRGQEGMLHRSPPSSPDKTMALPPSHQVHIPSQSLLGRRQLLIQINPDY